MPQISTRPTNSSSPNMYFGIELLRFVMSVTVITLHLFNWIGPPTSGLLTVTVSRNGELAVPTFWCLSGFVFYGVYGERISNQRLSLKDFALGRFTRLYPLAFTTLILTLFLNEVYIKTNNNSFIWHRGDAYHFILNMFMASHWGLQRFTAFNGPMWSISVELLVYFIFYGVVKNISNSTWIAALMIVLGKILSHFEPNLTHFYSISTCIQCFFTGAIVHSLYNVIKQYKQSSINYASTIVIACLAVTWIALPRQYAFQLVPPLYVLSFQLILRQIPDHCCTLVKTLGSVTYASYLLHYPLLLTVVMALDSLHVPRSSISTNVGICMFLITSLVISRFIYVIFELPVQSILRKWLLNWR